MSYFALADKDEPLSVVVVQFELPFFSSGLHYAFQHVSSPTLLETKIYDLIIFYQSLPYHIFHLDRRIIFKFLSPFI